VPRTPRGAAVRRCPIKAWLPSPASCTLAPTTPRRRSVGKARKLQRLLSRVGGRQGPEGLACTSRSESAAGARYGGNARARRSDLEPRSCASEPPTALLEWCRCCTCADIPYGAPQVQCKRQQRRRRRRRRRLCGLRCGAAPLRTLPCASRAWHGPLRAREPRDSCSWDRRSDGRSLGPAAE
jgi:hypothetical protein